MNGFVPVLIVILLSELGQRNALSLVGGRDAAVWVAMIAIVVAATVAGQAMAARMTDWAGALMVAAALALAGVGQLFKTESRVTLKAVLWSFWSGSVPLLTFAFAIRFGPWATGLGALAGLIAAAAVTSIAVQNAMRLRMARALAAIVLLVVAAIVALNALRLV